MSCRRESAKARYEYFLDEFLRRALRSPEPRSNRSGLAEGSIAESYAELRDNQVWLVNASLPEFSHGNRFNHEPKRPRKLLLHEREINKLRVGVSREGMTLIPLSVYFNGRGRAKVELALAKGKKIHDKRATIKDAIGNAIWARCSAAMVDRNAAPDFGVGFTRNSKARRWIKVAGCARLRAIRIASFGVSPRRSVPRGVALGLLVGIFC